MTLRLVNNDNFYFWVNYPFKLYSPSANLLLAWLQADVSRDTKWGPCESIRFITYNLSQEHLLVFLEIYCPAKFSSTLIRYTWTGELRSSAGLGKYKQMSKSRSPTTISFFSFINLKKTCCSSWHEELWCSRERSRQRTTALCWRHWRKRSSLTCRSCWIYRLRLGENQKGSETTATNIFKTQCSFSILQLNPK